MHKTLSILLLCLVSGLAGCKQTATHASAGTVLPTQFPGVVTADGISRAEAEIMLKQCNKGIGCGGFHTIRDGGTVWVVDGNLGFAGRPVSFNIDKATGEIGLMQKRQIGGKIVETINNNRTGPSTDKSNPSR